MEVLYFNHQFETTGTLPTIIILTRSDNYKYNNHFWKEPMYDFSIVWRCY